MIKWKELSYSDKISTITLIFTFLALIITGITIFITLNISQTANILQKQSSPLTYNLIPHFENEEMKIDIEIITGSLISCGYATVQSTSNDISEYNFFTMELKASDIETLVKKKELVHSEYSINAKPGLDTTMTSNNQYFKYIFFFTISGTNQLSCALLITDALTGKIEGPYNQHDLIKKDILINNLATDEDGTINQLKFNDLTEIFNQFSDFYSQMKFYQ